MWQKIIFPRKQLFRQPKPYFKVLAQNSINTLNLKILLHITYIFILSCSISFNYMLFYLFYFIILSRCCPSHLYNDVQKGQIQDDSSRPSSTPPSPPEKSILELTHLQLTLSNWEETQDCEDMFVLLIQPLKKIYLIYYIY